MRPSRRRSFRYESRDRDSWCFLPWRHGRRAVLDSRGRFYASPPPWDTRRTSTRPAARRRSGRISAHSTAGGLVDAVAGCVTTSLITVVEGSISQAIGGVV